MPEEVRPEIRGSIDTNVTWLAERLSTFEPEDIVLHRADAIYAAVAGAQLRARGEGGLSRYDKINASYRSIGLLPA